MIIDTNSLKNDSELQADICILGAGAAGISLALQLKDRYKIILIEGGGHTQDASTQDLYNGLTTLPNGTESRVYLSDTRRRYFGGTANVWAGICAEFSKHDFEKKEWVPDSGWPISFEQIKPYYERAAETLDLEHLKPQTNAGPPDDFELIELKKSNVTSFGERHLDSFKSNKNIQVLLEANVLQLHSTNQLDIAWASIILKSSVRIKIKAKRFVLCLGGIENARVLLNTQADTKSALKFGSNIGKFFMEHSFGNAGILLRLNSKKRDFGWLNRAGGLSLQTLALKHEAQKQKQILQCRFHFSKVQKPPEGVPHEKDISTLLRTLGQGTEATTEYFEVGYLLENAPKSESRVVLDESRDKFGLRKPRLFWKAGDVEVKTLEQSIRALSTSLARTGEFRLFSSLTAKNAISGWAAHHLGTTRMSTNVKDGVVDPNCLVFGTNNLFACGSSVFCTGGHANPTFTIVALAMRLADHFKKLDAVS